MSTVRRRKGYGARGPFGFVRAVVLGVLLIAPAVQADLVAEMPDGMVLDRGILASGHLTPHAWQWTDPVSSYAVSAGWSPGRLTVCPVEAREGALLTALRLLDDDCPGARHFESPVLSFAAGTRLQWAGRMAVESLPPAGVAVFYEHNATAGLLLPDVPATFSRLDDAYRFAADNRAGGVTVHAGGEHHAYNGTGYAFVHDGAQLTILSGGWMGRLADPARLDVRPSGNALLADALRPEVLQDLQAGILSPDAREGRANATRLVSAYARLWRVMDGALVGYVDGKVGSVSFSGQEAVLARSEAWMVQREADEVHAAGRATLVLAGTRVGDAGGLAAAPTVLGIVAWLAAVVAMVLRRTPPRRPMPHRLVALGGCVWAFILADWFVLHRVLGTGLLAEWGSSAPDRFAAGVYTLVLVTLLYIALVLPLRVLAGRFLPQRLLLPVEAALFVVVPVLAALFATNWVAAGQMVARI